MNSIKYRNLEFTKNNIYVIFGDNGVGKTTFLTSIFLFKKCFNENIYYDRKSVVIFDNQYEKTKNDTII